MTPTLSWYGMYPEAERSAAPLLLLLLLLPLLIKNIHVSCRAAKPNEKVPELFLSFPFFLGKIEYIYATKLLQKREMRKDIVIELSYKGFSRASDYS